MAWLRKLLGASLKEELEGTRLDYNQQYWEIGGPKTFSALLTALDGWLPDGSVLYFEGGSLDKEIEDFMRKNSIPEQTHIAFGTIWPRPDAYHVPASKEVLGSLSRIMEHHAEPELAIHFHVYRAGIVLLEWHDAFDDDMLLSGDFSEKQVKELCKKLGTQYSIVEQQRK